MILVFCEVMDGGLRRPSMEALSAARCLGDASGLQVGALFIGAGCSVAEQAARFGPDRIFKAEGSALDAYSSDAFAAVSADAVKATGATVFLAAATTTGKDLAPRVAARLGAGYAADVTALSLEDGRLRVERPIHGGKAIAACAFTTPLRVATTRPHVFPEAESPREAVIETLPVPAMDIKALVTALKAKSTGRVELPEADIVVAGGRGMKDGANFRLLEELAEALGGVVGASRAAVDAGWSIPHAMQIGQTGKVISPSLYIACGISGTVQHVAGMGGAKVIVAINRDPEAPIFKLATYGIVGDLFEVVPELIAALRRP